MRVEIFEDRCIGSGVCVLVAGEVFDQREDDGVVILLDAHPAAEHHDAVYEAETRCPAAVIEIHATG